MLVLNSLMNNAGLHQVMSDDLGYNNLTLTNTEVKILEDDTVGIEVKLSDGTTQVREGGKTDTIDIVLTSKPSSNVTIEYLSSNALQAIAPLVFTPDNWDQPQSVTIIANEDQINQGQIRTTPLSATVNSNDVAYNGFDLDDISVEIGDIAGIGFSKDILEVGKGDRPDSYEIILNSQPFEDVTIDFFIEGGLLQGIPSITFSADNWNIAKTIEVKAIEDIFANNINRNNTQTTADSTALSLFSTETEITRFSSEDDSQSSSILAPETTSLSLTSTTATTTTTAKFLNPFYDYKIVAETGLSGFDRLGTGPSINDDGDIAFTGYGSSTPDSVYVLLNGANSPIEITDLTRDFGDNVEINNQDLVVAVDTHGLTNQSHVRVWKAQPGVSGESTIIAESSFLDFNNPFEKILPSASINNNGDVVFSVLQETGIGDFTHITTSEKINSSNFEIGKDTLNLGLGEQIIRPQIADTGEFVFVLPTNTANPTPKVSLVDKDLNVTNLVEDQFSALNISPSISSSGKIVAFAGFGDINDGRGSGSGIFINYDAVDGKGFNNLVRLTGGFATTFTNQPIPFPDLGYNNQSERNLTNPIYFSDFDINTRI